MSRDGWRSRHYRAAMVAGLIYAALACSCAAQQMDVPEYVQEAGDGAIVVNPVTAAQWALERNTELRIQRQAIPEAEGQLQQARAGDAVSVGLSGSAARMGPVSSFELPAGDGETRTVQTGQEESYQATISARKPLYTGGRVDTSVNLARESITSARQSTDAAALSIMLATQEAAYAVLRTDQLAAVAAARVTALAEHLRNAEVREEAGVAPHFEVVQARTELARAQGDLIEVQTAVDQARAALRRLLALPQQVDLQVADPPPPAEPDAGGRDELIERAWEGRPEVDAAQTGVRLARLSVSLAQKAMEPTVALTGQYSRQSAGGLSAETESWQIALVAEKPILDGGARDGQVQSARARLEAAELQLQRTREEIGLEVVQQMLAVEEARERIETAQQGLVEARERRRMAQLRYNEGIASGIEVIDADTALAAAEGSLVNAQYDLYLAVTRLHKAMGMMGPVQQEVETQ